MKEKLENLVEGTVVEYEKGKFGVYYGKNKRRNEELIFLYYDGKCGDETPMKTVIDISKENAGKYREIERTDELTSRELNILNQNWRNEYTR